MASISSLGVGSGLDLNGLLNQLEAAERQRLQPITQQKRSVEAQISAYGKLESALSAFQDAASKLSSSETFAATTSSSSFDGITVAANNTAAPGSYAVTVNNLARNYSIASFGVADDAAELGAGSVDIALGDGTNFSVAIDAASSSLAEVRDAINAQQSDVQASIVNDGSGTPYRLVLSSAQSGTDSAITSLAYTGDLALSMGTDAATEITAQNASLTVNGIAISSQTNQVEGAIEGVTMSLTQAGTGTVSVVRDQETIQGSISGFVDAYNELQDTIGSLNNFDVETGVAGQLLGDSGLRSVESSLRSILDSQVAEGAFSRLSDVGISRQLGGKLEIDEARLAELSSTDLAEVTTFFAGTATTDGFAKQTSVTLGQLLDDNGPIATRTEGFKSQIDRLDDRFVREEDLIATTVERYRKQFAQLDSLIASMNSTSAYLGQQFAAMDAQLGKG